MGEWSDCLSAGCLFIDPTSKLSVLRSSYVCFLFPFYRRKFYFIWFLISLNVGRMTPTSCTFIHFDSKVALSSRSYRAHQGLGSCKQFIFILSWFLRILDDFPLCKRVQSSPLISLLHCFQNSNSEIFATFCKSYIIICYL